MTIPRTSSSVPSLSLQPPWLLSSLLSPLLENGFDLDVRTRAIVVCFSFFCVVWAKGGKKDGDLTAFGIGLFVWTEMIRTEEDDDKEEDASLPLPSNSSLRRPSPSRPVGAARTQRILPSTRRRRRSSSSGPSKSRPVVPSVASLVRCF
jgi:hypothetical protein